MNTVSLSGDFFRLVKTQFYRLFKTKSFYIIGAVFIAFIALDILSTYSMVRLDWYEDVGAADDIMEMLQISGAGYFAAIAALLFNGRDFSQKTMRNKITAGFSRGVIYFSTLLVDFAVLVIYIAAFLVLEIAVALPIFGWNAPEHFVAITGYNLLSLIPMMALVAMVSFIARSSKNSILICVLVVFACTILSIFAYMPEYLLYDIITRLNFGVLAQFTQYYFEGYYDMSGYVLTLWLNYIISTALFVSVGYIVFKRCDLK